MLSCVVYGVPNPITVTIGARDLDYLKLTERVGDRIQKKRTEK